MLDADLTQTVCRNAGNWEGRTVEWDNVSCPDCILDKPKPKSIPFYTMIMRKIDEADRKEVVLYGQAAEHVMTQFGMPNLADNPEFNDGSWELVIRPYNQ